MSKEKEVIAYAITHAGFDKKGKAIKGGPYEAESGPPGEECDSLREACRWPTTEADARECATMYLEDHLSWQGDARVIRIVRARPIEAVDWTNSKNTYPPGVCTMRSHLRTFGQEASAVEVLRDIVAAHDAYDARDDIDDLRDLDALIPRARRVLAASGPDPMPVVRAAMRETMRETEAERVFNRAIVTGRSVGAEADDLIAAREERAEAVGKYTKAGGK